jgi:hypothetical protein
MIFLHTSTSFNIQKKLYKVATTVTIYENVIFFLIILLLVWDPKTIRFGANLTGDPINLIFSPLLMIFTLFLFLLF